MTDKFKKISQIILCVFTLNILIFFLIRCPFRNVLFKTTDESNEHSVFLYTNNIFHFVHTNFINLNCNFRSSGHFSYQKHNCTSAHKKDVQVPACPLCGEPVPTPRGISPDMTVGQHIDQYCKSDKTKIFTNKCSYKNCKKKELIPVQCTVCRYNYCLRHRHTADHECNPANARRNLAA